MATSTQSDGKAACPARAPIACSDATATEAGEPILRANHAVQREATDAVMRHFFGGGDGVGDGDGSGSSRATVVLPGGAGKTVLALRVAEAMHARGTLRSVLVLAPSLALVTQTMDEWKLWGEGLDASRALAVCSDADGADFTTSPDEVERFLAEAAAADVPAVMVGTYASHERVAEALARRGGELDLLICDEAHDDNDAARQRSIAAAAAAEDAASVSAEDTAHHCGSAFGEGDRDAAARAGRVGFGAAIARSAKIQPSSASWP